MTTSHIATVEVPFEALAKELGTKRAIEFISEIRECYGDSVVELRGATETLTIEQIEAEVKTLKKQRKTEKRQKH
jgi:molybdopterin converting factor small subunit